MRYDELGIRMKSFEALTTQRKLMHGLPVYARIDGKAFHTFCRGLNKPFCMELVETMQEVCKYLVEKTNAKLGYVQSDEISLCWLDVDKAPFDGKLHKLESVLASMASAKFCTYINETYYKNFLSYEQLSKKSDPHCESWYYKQQCENWFPLYDKVRKLIPSFDCRVFQLPNETELANCFIWREIDAVRNSVQMLGQANFSHNSLQGLSAKDIQNKLLTEKDINWNNLDTELKRGTYYKRVLVEKELDDITWNKIPEHKKPESRIVIRSQIQQCNFPVMKSVQNKVGTYFYDEEPILV